MNIKEYIKEQRLITDGAMGTYYEEKYSEDTVIVRKGESQESGAD